MVCNVTQGSAGFFTWNKERKHNWKACWLDDTYFLFLRLHLGVNCEILRLKKCIYVIVKKTYLPDYRAFEEMESNESLVLNCRSISNSPFI